MIPAVPYIVLAVFGTISIVLYIAGCAITNNWWALFGILLQIIAIIFAIIFTHKLVEEDSWNDEKSCIEHIFTVDSTLWFFMVFQCSAIGLCSVFYHCTTINLTCFLMQLGGDVAVIIGFIVYVILTGKVKSSVFGD